MKIKYIYIHHSAISQWAAQFDTIDNYHRQKWGFVSSLGLYGAYNYLIEKMGQVRQYRAEGEETAAQRGHNFDSISICVAGNFEKQGLTPEQKKALTNLVKRVRARHNLSKTAIKMHRELSATLCPGKSLVTWIEDYRTKNNAKQDMQVQLDAIKLILERLWRLLRSIKA